MTTRLCLVDCGIGNIRSIENAVHFLGCDSYRGATPDALEHADAFIFPGVGAFGEAMAALRERNLVSALESHVLDKRTPYLGICLGLQLVARSSSENGHHAGLGWIDASVEQIPRSADAPSLHVGWNTLTRNGTTPLFEGINADANFYFDHRYSLLCDPSTVLATTPYTEPLVAAIQSDNIFATQFHPEKSQTNGLRVLRNFLNHVERTVDQPLARCSSNV
tara:strand:- start:339 stop:1001 length:663 start_codon:yes stop_codon:yes gene_type:complete